MSENPCAPGSSDVNLLFGIVALQMDFIRHDDLIRAMNAWVIDKSKPLGVVLCELGVLSVERRELLDALVREHLKLHNNDSKESLAALGAVVTPPEGIGEILDPDLDQSYLALTQSAHSSGSPSTAPRRPGTTRYRILRSHAKGGLGEVFVAEDVELRREVALKEIQSHRADDPGSRTRLVLEAEITGGLEHPGIIPVYGLGTYPNGRPYYAMRFVRGESLQALIERYHSTKSPLAPGERRLAFRALLQRLIDVCNAIAYAHSRGVIHRDLKPSNIMLGRYGETLVVDWGLAKAGVDSRLRNPDPEAPTTDPIMRPAAGNAPEILTLPGRAMGTPSYMSPEQAAGRVDQIGPASDIYALGAMLFTIITGRKAFEGTDSNAIIERVKTGIFPAPHLLNRDAPPALEAICLKAMSLKPEDRFSTATALASEIEHWLADEPTTVYRDPWTVRFMRWSRRNRTLVASLAVFLTCSVIALSISTALVWREEKRTAIQKSFYEQLLNRTNDLISVADAEFTAIPKFRSVRAALYEEISISLRNQLENFSDDLELRQRTIEAHRRWANFHRLEGRFDLAEPIYDKGIELSRDGLKNGSNDRRIRTELVQILRESARLISDSGDLSKAKKSLSESVEIAESLVSEDPTNSNSRRWLATSMLALASVEHTRGDRVESKQRVDASIAMFRDLAQLPSEQIHPYDSLLFAGGLNLLAVLEREQKHLAVALPLHLEANTVLNATNKKPPKGLNENDLEHFMALFRYEQAGTWKLSGEPVEKIDKNLSLMIQQTWEDFSKQFPNLYMYRESLGRAYRLRGEIRIRAAIEGGLQDLEKSRQIFEKLTQDFPKIPRFLGELGRTQLALALRARETKDEKKASDWFSQAEKSLREAIRRSPENFQDQQSLSDVVTGREKNTKP